MSRSRRKTPIFGIAKCPSEKDDKRVCHGIFRRMERDAIAAEQFDACPGKMAAAMNIWTMGKDGKSWWGDAPAKYLRK